MVSSCLIWDPLQGVQKEAPVLLDRADLDTFVRAVRPTDVGPKTHHVHFRIIRSEDAAFQARVAGKYTRRFIVFLFVQRFQGGDNGAAWVGRPTGVLPAEFSLESSQAKGTSDAVCVVVFLGVHRASAEALQADGAIANFDPS